MPQMRLALAQINPTVGALDSNADAIVAATKEAVGRDTHLIAFGEMALTGYPVEDLALRASFVEASRRGIEALAERLADEGLGEAVVVVGYLGRSEEHREALGRPRGGPQNCAAVLHRGEVVARYAKHHLPNYGVFDEYRYFVPGDYSRLIRVHGVDVAITICEDLWQDGGPVAAARDAGAGLLLVLNGSPYERDKDDVRLELCARRAREAGCPLAYVNLVGGQDELVFDGDSLIVGGDGQTVARGPQFRGALVVADLDLAAASSDADDAAGMPVRRQLVQSEPATPSDDVAGETLARLSAEAEMYGALVLGLRDYVEKNGFRTVVFGLSGGIDSALVAAVACDALGADHVHGVSMPSTYSSDHSRGDAAEMAERTGLQYRSVPINPMVDAFQNSLALSGLAEENLQARVRAVILMGLSNAEGHLVLATGNKSELAVGYSTIYGDAVGGFAPIKDVLKTVVWRLARWRNAEAERRGQTPPIPENSITKPPSAELRPGQMDSDSLPDYALLDDILDDYVERDASSAELVDAGFDHEVVERTLRLVDAAEYKRRQYPPGPKISVRNFGRDRRLPITNAWREVAPQTDHESAAPQKSSKTP